MGLLGLPDGEIHPRGDLRRGMLMLDFVSGPVTETLLDHLDELIVVDRSGGRDHHRP